MIGVAITHMCGFCKHYQPHPVNMMQCTAMPPRTRDQDAPIHTNSPCVFYDFDEERESWRWKNFKNKDVT